jgi:serine/threonine protein kinase
MPLESSGAGASKDPLVGTVVGRHYRVIARLGQGGMGVTYRAWDQESGRPVVLKHPKREFSEKPDFIERFSREAKMMAAFSHPNVVPITTVGEHDGIPYFVMPFLPGGSLSNRRLRNDSGEPQPMHPSTLQLWLPQVAAALDYVQSQGVIHRDVKPGNVFFDAFSHAYLGDFGIAKVVADTTSLDREQTLTATNMAIGTQEYMAPEMFAPKAAVDGRVDQYALGVMVYETLAGRRPFTGDTAHVIVEVTTREVPPLTGGGRNLPSSLEQAVYRSLAKRPDERFASCLAFAQAALAQVPQAEQNPGVARLLCPECGNLLKLPTTAAGKDGKCPRCHQQMTVANDLSALWLLRELREDEAAGAERAGRESPLTAGPAIDENFLAEFNPAVGGRVVVPAGLKKQRRESLFTAALLPILLVVAAVVCVILGFAIPNVFTGPPTEVVLVAWAASWFLAAALPLPAFHLGTRLHPDRFTLRIAAVAAVSFVILCALIVLQDYFAASSKALRITWFSSGLCWIPLLLTAWVWVGSRVR